MGRQTGLEKHFVLKNEDVIFLPLPDHAPAPIGPGYEARAHYSHSYFSIYDTQDDGKEAEWKAEWGIM